MISLVASRVPRSKRTARRASLGVIPCLVFSSAAIARKPYSCSSSSPAPLNSEKQRSCIQAKNAPAHLFDSDGDAVPVHWSSASVFKRSISSVPCTRSLGLLGIGLSPGKQEEHTLLILIVKGRGLSKRSAFCAF